MSVRRPHPAPRAPVLLASGAALLGGLLAGCGDETSSASGPSDFDRTSVASASPTPSPQDPSSSSPAASPSPSSDPTAGYPDCVKVWVDGKRLPGAYEGCAQGRKVAKPDGRYCEFGKSLITFGTHFYAVPGGTIHQTSKPLKKDPGYQAALTSCQG